MAELGKIFSNVIFFYQSAFSSQSWVATFLLWRVHGGHKLVICRYWEGTELQSQVCVTSDGWKLPNVQDVDCFSPTSFSSGVSRLVHLTLLLFSLHYIRAQKTYNWHERAAFQSVGVRAVDWQ